MRGADASVGANQPTGASPDERSLAPILSMPPASDSPNAGTTQRFVIAVHADVFFSAMAGALVGSLVSFVATVIALRAERRTALAAIRHQDILAASSELHTAFYGWFRVIQLSWPPLGEPFNDAHLEEEMRNRVRLTSLRYRLPGDVPIGPAIDNILEMYDDWLKSWIDVPEPTLAQIQLPSALRRAAVEVVNEMPAQTRELRRRLG